MLMETHHTPLTLRERARGAYLGLAVGDALGAPVEFMTPSEIAAAHGEHRMMTGGGWLRLRPGQITDDTQMALALGDAIVQSQAWDLRNVAEHFLAWLRSRPIDIGNTCRRGIVRYMHEGSLEAPYDEGAAGNGVAMRNLPVILHTLHSVEAFERQTIEQGHLTHHHPLSDEATLALGRITRALLGGADMAACRTIADDLVVRVPKFRFVPYPRRATGYVVDTMQTVLHFFFNTQSFEQCLIGTVNAGGDADTNGAIVGMLAGALYGERAIPQRWLLPLEREARLRVEAQVDALLALAERDRAD